MNDPAFRAGIRRGLAEAIEIVEWEERKWAPGAKPASTIARTRNGRTFRHLAFQTAKLRIFAQLKRYERAHYRRCDPFTGRAILRRRDGETS